MTTQEAIKEIKQNRSKFQFEKFVVGQHHSPEMQYYQLLLEIETLQGALEENNLRIRKLYAEAEELRETGKKSDAIEAEIKELSAKKLEENIMGTKRELEYLEELFDEYPKYTREEIEAAQPEYWKQRLIRTAQLQYLSAMSGGIPWAQFEALYQADILPKALEEIKTLNQLENKPSKLLTLNVQKELEEQND